jgi:ABC-type thiamine transport system ATPase subunit
MIPPMLELRQVSKSYAIGGPTGSGKSTLLNLLGVFAGAVAIGTVAAAIPAWLTARAPLADALSYE